MSDKPDIPHADWAFPTEIRFGPGRVRELPELCRELGVAKPLLVTDSGIAALPMTAAILNSCQADGLGIALFSDVQPNPVE
ncbi:MAG: iron-containing alcohol dehydrogenase, partial [Rhodospirillaceae bacterium]|nr:iron-containing alcohol dehydrogenase [Rhodospirillaceae bacterium]